MQRARVDTEVRTLADDASDGLSRAWVDAVRRASTSKLGDLGDRLDAAMAGTDLGVRRIPRWAGAVRLLQWLLILGALAGALWLGALAAVEYLQMPEPPLPEVEGYALPTVVLLGSVGAGFAAGSRVPVPGRATARRRGRGGGQGLRGAVHEVADELVVQPIAAELEAYAVVREGLAKTLK